MISVKNLKKTYLLGGEEVHALDDVSLLIKEHEFVAIIGQSGSGKSTLLYSLSTMDKPTSGEVFVLEKNVTTMNEKQIASMRKKEVSFVFQSMNLLPDLTIFENIAYCGYGTDSKNAIHTKTMQLLKELGLQGEEDKYPSELSGGQQQRVAIARALIGGATIIFGDEPTGALNSSMGKQVLDIFTELNHKGQSIVMVTHDIKAATRATRLLYLTDGKIDGDLNLGKYTHESYKEREEMIFSFLKDHNW